MHLAHLIVVDVPFLRLYGTISGVPLLSLHPVVPLVAYFRAEVDHVTNSVVSIASVFGHRLLDACLIILFVFVELAAIVLMHAGP